jgi:selT/selW/selH-like putative selenoprotein
VAELKANGIQAKDIPGSSGQFDVVRDGELVYSKHETGRFPEHDEILAALR